MLYLDLFRSSYIEQAPITGVRIIPELNYLRRLYSFNGDQISKYYRERNFAVKNNHILSRILEHFPFYANYDSFKYLDYALEKTKYLAKHFKFTSEIERGITHPPYFFGNGGEEVIIASYENFNVEDVVKNWRTTSSVTILKVDRTTTKLLLPLGKDDGEKASFSFIMINIPKLALQYREFMKEQYRKLSSEDGILLNKNHFVMKYVLSNTISDIIDFMLFNRVKNKFYGIENAEEVKFKHPFKIFEPLTQISKYVDETLDVITNKQLDFVNLLNNIQLIFKVSALELLLLPEIPLTTNVKWALFLSRLEYMIFMYDVASRSRSLDKNRHFLNDWKRLAERVERDNLLNKIELSYEDEKNIKENLYKVKQF